MPKKQRLNICFSRSKKASKKLATIAREIDEEEGTFDTADTNPIVPSKPPGRNRHGKRPTSQAVELSANADDYRPNSSVLHIKGTAEGSNIFVTV